MTGVELTGDSCVIVDVTRRSGLPRLSALHVIEPAEWPPDNLEQIRRRRPFSSRAHVVQWVNDPAGLAALVDAGFRIDAVVTPEQALAIVASERNRPTPIGATAWIALSRHGAALVILKGLDVLYSKRIPWTYKKTTRPNEQLLQRYLFVAHLAPELQHAMGVVGRDHGTTVDAVVTCGDLPDLRSLTMPLTEELDIEVETLDSLDGFEVTKTALGDRAIEYAPALRLAAAATAVRPATASPVGRWWRRGAAAVMLIAAGTWFTVSMNNRRPPANPKSPSQVPPAPAATTGGADAPPAVVPLVPSAAASNSPRTTRVSAEPVPSLHSILLGPGRRLAIVNGSIVGEGDTVGRRTVTKIERDAVFLRDTSGEEIKLAVAAPLKPGTHP
jgi:hypothetical protein